MSDVAIRVEGLSKRYRTGARKAGGTLSELLNEVLLGGFRRRKETRNNSEFWALRDVSFEVERGEVVGIIGRNGAGKSTLVKILSRITEPSSGRAEVFGRVGSLLEVGTGFHPELTGRENVYLNGAILGMRRAEIDDKFDEIVGFAEVERFIDTPVKHYSSGMYVRLAFSVTAHLEPEVLIVDEVLAVGDSSFQSRCIKHFHHLQNQGTSILLISHNMNLIRSICRRALLIEQGSVLGTGSPAEITQLYNGLQFRGNQRDDKLRDLQESDPIRWGDGRVVITNVYTGAENKQLATFSTEQSIQVAIEFQALDRLEDVVVGFAISNNAHASVFATNSEELDARIPLLVKGHAYRAVFTVQNVFGDGTYFVSCAVNNSDKTRPYCRMEDISSFQVFGRSGRSLIWPSQSFTIGDLKP